MPFSGSPWYIELASDDGVLNGSRGGAVADYGSHFGVKATLYENQPLYMGNVAAVAHSLGDNPGRCLGGKFDRTYFELFDEDDEPVALERQVHFESWGWRETLTAPGYVVHATVLTLAEDAHLLLLDVRGKPGVKLRMRVYADERTKHIDRFNEYEGSTRSEASLEGERDELHIDRGFEAADPSMRHLHRVYRFSERIDDFRSSPGVEEYTFEVTTRPLQSRQVSVVLGWGLTEEQATERAAAAADIVGDDPDRAVRAVEDDWREFFAALPRPEGGQERQQVYRLANTALRMNLYAPRGDMPMWGAVPNKGHYNQFNGWDTGLHGIGYREWIDWNPSWIDQSRYTIAEQILLLQMRAAFPSGQIANFFLEDLTWEGPPVRFRGDDEPYECDPDAPVYNPLDGDAWAKPSVQGWAIWEIARRDPDADRRRRFLDEAYPVLTCHFEFWMREKDADSDGLVEVTHPSQTGWDDTPRLPRDNKAREAIDVNAWLALYADSLALIAKELGKADDADLWRERGANLAKHIEEHLWSEQLGGWQDRDGTAVDAPFRDVSTPVMWWPAFAGSVTDESHARRVIEEHLLDPERFYGRYPIPTVAYNDPAYNKEGHGRYAKGQEWQICTYASLVALERYGYPAEADEILDRTVAMMAQFGGVYEHYCTLDGWIGLGPEQVAERLPVVFQFGFQSSLIAQALLGRHKELPPAQDTAT